MGDKHRFSLIGLETFKVLDVRSTRVRKGTVPPGSADDWGGLTPIRGIIIPFEMSGRKVVHIRASAGGELFGLWSTPDSPEGFATISLHGGEARVVHEHESNSHLLPGPDGRTVYTGGRGRVDQDGKMLGRQEDDLNHLRMIPSADPRYYLVVSVPGPEDEGTGISISFREAGTDRVLSLLNEPLHDLAPLVEQPKGLANGKAPRLDFDRRFHWVPAARLLAVIPPGDDRILLYQVATADESPSPRANPEMPQ
jgi:hypothetical protein